MSVEEFERKWFERRSAWCSTCRKPVVANEYEGYMHATEEYPWGASDGEECGHVIDTEEWWEARRDQDPAGPLFPPVGDAR